MFRDKKRCENNVCASEVFLASQYSQTLEHILNDGFLCADFSLK